MKNTIFINNAENVKISLENSFVCCLKNRKPNGCPFSGYSLFDLLFDFIKMYSWEIEKNKEITIKDFLFSLSHHEKVKIYTNDILKCEI